MLKKWPKANQLVRTGPEELGESSHWTPLLIMRSQPRRLPCIRERGLSPLNPQASMCGIRHPISREKVSNKHAAFCSYTQFFLVIFLGISLMIIYLVEPRLSLHNQKIYARCAVRPKCGSTSEGAEFGESHGALGIALSPHPSRVAELHHHWRLMS